MGAYYSGTAQIGQSDWLRVRSAGLYTGHDYRSILMAGPSPELVASRLSSVRCAICKTSDFMIDQRTVQSDGECRAMCKQCRYTFPVHTDMEFYQRTQPDIPYLMKTVPCPKCQKAGVTLDFRIVMSVREAHYFVTCNACRHQFAERSSLETFE